MSILEVKDLKVGYVDVQRQKNIVVDGVSFSLEKGEALGIVGKVVAANQQLPAH